MSEPEDGVAGLAAHAAEGARLVSEAARAAGASAVQSDLALVKMAADLQGLASGTLKAAVDRARDAGRTWQEIGDVLGVTRQAAFQRFGHPIDPRTGKPMSVSIRPGAAEHATQLVIDWIANDYPAMSADFNDEVRQKASAQTMAAAWASVVGMVGAYEGMDAPVVRQWGDYTVVDIPLRFEAGEMNARVTYDTSGKVAGVFILDPKAAGSAGSAPALRVGPRGIGGQFRDDAVVEALPGQDRPDVLGDLAERVRDLRLDLADRRLGGAPLDGEFRDDAFRLGSQRDFLAARVRSRGGRQPARGAHGRYFLAHRRVRPPH